MNRKGARGTDIARPSLMSLLAYAILSSMQLISCNVLLLMCDSLRV